MTSPPHPPQTPDRGPSDPTARRAAPDRAKHTPGPLDPAALDPAALGPAALDLAALGPAAPDPVAPDPANPRSTRRDSLLRLGGLLAGAATGSLVLDEAIDAASAQRSGPAGVASGQLTCVLTPEATAGPYFLEDDTVRRNITEGRPGAKLILNLTVVDASTCKPIKGAAVDIWHCDALGVYSGVAGEPTEDERFCRGIQRTNARGTATFQTIYPGWYPGRTVHIHTRVFLGGNILHTGQLYFSDAVTDVVYRRAPYRTRPNRDPRNPGDSIYRNGGSRSTLKLKRVGAGYVGSITMGVMRG